jgi:hypothetical protein
MVTVTNDVKRAPIWPLIIAPFVCFVYYILFRFAFMQSIDAIIRGPSDVNASVLEDFAKPFWGSHWIYRGIAEYISVTLAVFVAGGLARGRARTAAVVGSLAVSLFYAVRFGLILWAWYSPETDWKVDEPWYQYVIDGLVMLGAPVAALETAEHIEQAHSDGPGLAGINRWHFAWLWILAYFYALAIITPLARFYSVQIDGGFIAIILVIIVNFVPAFAVGLPLYYGLEILRGTHGDTMPPPARNLVGALVLIGGLIVGLAVQFGWYWMFDKLGHAISG